MIPGRSSQRAPHTKMINYQQKLYVLHKKDPDSEKSICNFYPYVKQNINYFVFSRNTHRLNANVISVT